MYRLASPGLTTPPCGVPRSFPFPPVNRRFPSQTTFLTCRAHYPGGPDRYTMVIVLARSRAGFFPIRSAFPSHLMGRLPHCRFRGLLELHTHYGLPGCSPTYSGLFHEVSASLVTQTRRSIAIESNHQLFEWACSHW